MTGDEYDAALRLLDRQIVDCDGMAVGKVDDLELTETPEGVLVPTGLLLGPPALLPRFGPRLGSWLLERYVQLRVVDADRSRPVAIDFELVAEVASAVHLSARRDRLVSRRVDHPAIVRHRLGDLLGMRVMSSGTLRLARRSRVLDVRIAASDASGGVVALVVGPRRPGALLGYERAEERGPSPVATVVRWLHRGSRLVGVEENVTVDWSARTVRLGPAAELREISPGSCPGGTR